MFVFVSPQHKLIKLTLDTHRHAHKHTHKHSHIHRHISVYILQPSTHIHKFGEVIFVLRAPFRANMFTSSCTVTYISPHQHHRQRLKVIFVANFSTSLLFWLKVQRHTLFLMLCTVTHYVACYGTHFAL